MNTTQDAVFTGGKDGLRWTGPLFRLFSWEEKR